MNGIPTASCEYLNRGKNLLCIKIHEMFSVKKMLLINDWYNNSLSRRKTSTMKPNTDKYYYM